MNKWATNFAGFKSVKYVTDRCITGRNLGLREEDSLTGKRIPTEEDVKSAFQWLLDDACPGDTLLFHYSGHGTYLREHSPSQCNHRDEALVLPKTEKAKKNPLMTGDDIFHHLVTRVPHGVHLFAIVDACHSGTIFDLPFNWNHWDHLRTDPKKPTFKKSQFDWEWAQAPELLNRSYPLQGSVSLITGSQAWQTSGDAGISGGGVLTNTLIAKHSHQVSRTDFKKSPGVLTTALKEGWSWTQTMMEVINHVTGGKPKAVSNTQVPNFGATHRFDMDAAFSLDGFQGIDEDVSPGKCRKS
eukprot:CAMPEP_0197640138 /NCGR_PEP_ID=MMETSP1338-20131121/14532_1 /TAXON_ID=43686 ORGANISM="Pelagodinium beii, Strain RCC1491" /NCGR_SAMPLE_ID=MMETSP1338 /ASSEMBLY_ACC=CAM_ASM_000754 /LENGTH=298 /DNA_ID=CAMNT_0043212955 /DNA_START=17 /DNA_END=913 /DNA_ORIENTATION=+